MFRKKIYLLLTLACLAGYAWLFAGLTFRSFDSFEGVCMFKRITHIPCPSCGSTRTILSIFHGEFGNAFMYNPLGFAILLFLIVCPILLAKDFIQKRNTLEEYYHKAEEIIRRPRIAIPAALLLVVNWIWSISKNL